MVNKTSEIQNENIAELAKDVDSCFNLFVTIIVKKVLAELSNQTGASTPHEPSSPLAIEKRPGLNEKGEKLVLSVAEAAGLLGISRPKAYGLVHSGELPNIRWGSRILIPRKALLKMLDEVGMRS